MKNLTILMLALAVSTYGAFAQNGEPATQSDTTEIATDPGVKNEGSIPTPPTPPAPPAPPTPPHVDVKEQGDSTVVNIGGMRVVVNEVDEQRVQVRIQTKDGTRVITTDKGNVTIDNEGIEIEGNDEDYDEDFEYEYNEEVGSEEDEEASLDNVDTRFLMLDIGVNGYLNSGGEFSTPPGFDDLELRYGRSINVNIHLLRQRLNLVRHHVNLMYGLSFEFNNYGFARDITLEPDMDIVTPVPTEDPVKKSKLSDTYFYVPVMLNFETNPQDKKRSFRVNAGGFGGVLLGAHTKMKTQTGKKVKARDDFNLANFRYGISGQIGYGWFNLYANYSLSNMFKEGEGPIATPFNIGIGIIGF